MMRLAQLRKEAFRAGLALLVFTTAAAAQDPSTLDELLDQARTGSQESRALNKQREAEFRAEKKERQRLLRVANRTRDREERRSEELEALFSENELAIIQLQELLRNRLGNLGELFGVVRQVAGDTRGVLDASMTSAQFPGRSESIGKLAESTKLPDIDALRGLWLTLLQEMTESGKVVRYRGAVVRPDGESVESEVVRLGVFNAVADGKFLRYQDGRLAELPRQPAGRHTAAAGDFQAATAGWVAMSVDPSRGSILGLLVQAPTLVERIAQGGAIGYIIIALGLVGLALVGFQFMSLTLTGRAMAAQRDAASANTGNPLGRVLAVYETHPEADTETLELRLDESILRDMPRLERFLSTLRVLSVIAPLLGLLGTVTGMIETFQQITLFGTGDPKLMAGGISEALVTTMLGLMTAIPLVLLHSLLRDRSRGLIQVLEEQSAGLIAERAERETA